jgi:hypothetical protein
MNVIVTIIDLVGTLSLHYLVQYCTEIHTFFYLVHKMAG